MDKKHFLIYGAYGYSGQLIVALAVERGLKPILAGRNREKLIQQAQQYQLDYRVFDVADLAATKKALADCVVVLNCAGPFILTYRNMSAACLSTQTHYVDITGEVKVFAALIDLNKEAIAANIMLLPGAGFDVVPSDCVAQHLKSRLPDANKLILAINALQNSAGSGLSISRGTAKTMLQGFADGTLIRAAGELTVIPLGSKQRYINFGNNKETLCTAISWGDLITAWWSTHIPHIETYMATSPNAVRAYKWLNPFKFIFRWNWVQRLAQQKINKLPEGPSEAARKNSVAMVYGEASRDSGEKVTTLLHTPDGYQLTALTSITIIKKILAGNAPVGYQTPTTAYTKDFILEIPGVTRQDA